MPVSIGRCEQCCGAFTWTRPANAVGTSLLASASWPSCLGCEQLGRQPFQRRTAPPSELLSTELPRPHVEGWWLTVLAIRPEVRALVELGSLPAEDVAGEEVLHRFQAAMEAIDPPVNADEARMLVQVFGPDDCFGAAWSLLHLIESAGQPVIDSEPPGTDEWRRRLWERGNRAAGGDRSVDS